MKNILFAISLFASFQLVSQSNILDLSLTANSLRHQENFDDFEYDSYYMRGYASYHLSYTPKTTYRLEPIFGTGYGVIQESYSYIGGEISASKYSRQTFGFLHMSIGAKYWLLKKTKWLYLSGQTRLLYNIVQNETYSEQISVIGSPKETRSIDRAKTIAPHATLGLGFLQPIGRLRIFLEFNMGLNFPLLKDTALENRVGSGIVLGAGYVFSKEDRKEDK